MKIDKINTIIGIFCGIITFGGIFGYFMFSKYMLRDGNTHCAPCIITGFYKGGSSIKAVFQHDGKIYNINGGAHGTFRESTLHNFDGCYLVEYSTTNPVFNFLKTLKVGAKSDGISERYNLGDSVYFITNEKCEFSFLFSKKYGYTAKESIDSLLDVLKDQ